MVILAETTGSTAFPQVTTLVDWTVAHRSVQVATGGGDKTHRQAHMTDGSCGSSALVQNTTASRSRSGLGSPSRFWDCDRRTDHPRRGNSAPPWVGPGQPVLGDSESQFQSQSASGSGRLIRTRRRPTALDAYILE